MKVKETTSNEVCEDQSAVRSIDMQGAAYQKERLVIFKEDRVGGQARMSVTIDEERVL